jgi:hypothetical protein
MTREEKEIRMNRIAKRIKRLVAFGDVAVGWESPLSAIVLQMRVAMFKAEMLIVGAQPTTDLSASGKNEAV